MKTSKERVYDYIKQETAKGMIQLDTRTISEALDMQRTNVSSLLNQLTQEGKIEKTQTRPVYYALITEKDEADSFEKMIGFDGSLSNVVQLAKAGVHYPNGSLNSLILGGLGSGKSFLGNLIFEYAKDVKILKQDATLTTVNCRHFINNVDDLKQMLFGRSHDGFKNVFEAAVGSILFIDNIHLLEGASMSRVINFIDTGKLMYLDGTQSEKLNVTLILSMDDASNKELLQSLLVKIPVLHQIPDLDQRPLEEKFKIINELFTEEAITTKYDIEIEPEVMYALLLIDTTMNIKSLYGLIKIAVANAYLRSYDSNIDAILVKIHDFDKGVKDALLLYRNHKEAIRRVIPNQFDFKYSKEGNTLPYREGWRDFYEYLNENISMLQKNEVDKDKVDDIINAQINQLIRSFKQEIQEAEINVDQLSKIVDREIIDIVTAFVSQNKEIDVPNSGIYGLCLHINAIKSSSRQQKYLSETKITEVKTQYPIPYRLAQNLAHQIEPLLNQTLNEDEVVLLAMFLIPEIEKEEKGYPQILIAMHGASSASSIAQVVNDLVKHENTYYYDMHLNKNTEEAYQELLILIEEIDQGHGIIVIYDMGSFKTMFQKISETQDISMRLVYVPITLLGIEASRKAAMHTDIDAVYHDLLSGFKKELSYVESNEMAIITLCHTGEGGAIEMKRYLQENYRDDIKFFSFAISDRNQLIKEVQKVKQFYDVKAFVGTYDPKLFGIPFVPISRVFEYEGSSLDALLLSNMDSKAIDFEGMLEYLGESIDIDKEKLEHCLPQTIEALDVLFGLDIDRKVGLYLHIGVMVDRILNKKQFPGNNDTRKYLEFRKEEMQKIRNAMKKLEQSFNMIVPDSEIANIYEIVRKGEGYDKY